MPDVLCMLRMEINMRFPTHVVLGIRAPILNMGLLSMSNNGLIYISAGREFADSYLLPVKTIIKILSVTGG